VGERICDVTTVAGAGVAWFTSVAYHRCRDCPDASAQIRRTGFLPTAQPREPLKPSCEEQPPGDDERDKRDTKERKRRCYGDAGECKTDLVTTPRAAAVLIYARKRLEPETLIGKPGGMSAVNI